jgi:hypothetical protein
MNGKGRSGRTRGRKCTWKAVTNTSLTAEAYPADAPMEFSIVMTDLAPTLVPGAGDMETMWPFGTVLEFTLMTSMPRLMPESVAAAVGVLTPSR